MRNWKRSFVIAGLLMVATTAFATTWAEEKIRCPVCNKKIKVDVPVSYGTYIYGWPSRLQMLFWPDTDISSLYHCKRCGYAALMADFASFPKEKAKDLKDRLSNLGSPEGKTSRTSKLKVPVTHWFKAAELGYAMLDKDDAFWNHFHRVAGYHFEKQGLTEEASAARSKVIALTEKQLGEATDLVERKELFIIKSAMLYLVDKTDEAKASILMARSITVVPGKEITEENAKNVNDYLNEVIDELSGHVEANESLDL